MKYFIVLAATACMFTWMACGNNEKPVDKTETTGTTPPVMPANSTTQPQTTPVNLDSKTTPSTTVVPANTKVATGMNPAHGEPGHRCDIAVGAPLNSKPAEQPAASAITTTSATTPATTPITISTDKSSQPAPTTAVAPGMNPAHGQPGHRCDIAVGAPLNSKPAQITATSATIPAPTPIASADKPAQPGATTAVVAEGTNPPHGQPGHRCDIAVGAPLSLPKSPNYTPPAANTDAIPKVVPIKNQ